MIILVTGGAAIGLAEAAPEVAQTVWLGLRLYAADLPGLQGWQLALPLLTLAGITWRRRAGR